MSFTNFSTGSTHSFGGTYVELVPNELIRYNDQFDDANLPGTMQVTITLKQYWSAQKYTLPKKEYLKLFLWKHAI